MTSLLKILNEIIILKGYWIELNGRVHSIFGNNHAQYAIENFRNILKQHFSDIEIDEKEEMNRKILNYLALAGFIRIQIEDNIAEIEMRKNTSRKALQSLRMIVAEKNIKRIDVEIIFNINQLAHKNYLNFNSIEEFDDYFGF